MSWKTPITLLVLFGVLLGAAYYGWRTIISPATDSGTPAAVAHKPQPPSCTHQQKFHKGQKVWAKDVVVNVYNAGSVVGLAGDTLNALADRGFKSGLASDAPGSLTTMNVTIIGNDVSTPPVKLVASQFKGVVKLRRTPALAAGIDVIIGDNFKGVDSAAKHYWRVAKDTKVCTKVGAGNA